MAESRKKQVYRRYVEEVMNKGHLGIIRELFHSDYVNHTAPIGDRHEGSVFDQVAQISKTFRTAFPDVHFTVEDLLDEGEWVATRVTGRGQHLGRPFLGIAPTGRRAAWTSTGFFRVKSGKIIEHYGQPDLLGLREQLSMTPEPGSLDENRAVVTRYLYENNLQHFDVLGELLDPAFVDHDPIPGQKPGVSGLKAANRAFAKAFPDVWFTVEDLVAEGDRVIGRGVIDGTHQGAYLDVPPTGKTVHLTGTRMFRVQNGKIAEGWLNLDLLGLMEQMGAEGR